MDRETITAVWTRARQSCEYCRLPVWAVADTVEFEVDHIIAKKHNGPTKLSNLALACFHCNGHKGSDIAGIDPLTRKLTRLFDPRRHSWRRHFRCQGAILVGRTAIGRVTLYVLNMNDPDFVGLRQELIRLELFDDIFF